MSPTIRPNVLLMEPYSPGKPISDVKRELGLEYVIKLASNENPFGPSPKALAAVEQAAKSMHLYPDGAARALRQAIATKFSIAENQILLGNGSDELIHLLGLLFLAGPEDELLMADPGFSRYDASAHLAASKLVKVPTDADFRHDLPAMAAAVTPNTKMIFIANPNNPTGTAVFREEFERFLDAIPGHIPVILDEAYVEFSYFANDLPSAIDYVRAGRNVIGLRTFSKAYGLAGIRLGYGFASAGVVDAYQRAREPFNVNSLAQAAGIAALEDDAHITMTAKNNRAGLLRLSEIFRSVGARPVDSYANFAYADMGMDADPVFHGLLKRGVIVRAGSHVGHPYCLRVTVGTEEEMDFFEHALKAVMAEIRASMAP